MPVYIQDFINVLAQICEDRNLQATVTGSLKGGLCAGGLATIGGLLFGPIGLAIGGALGGGVSAVMSKDSFKSVALVIRDMTPQQKQILYDKVTYAFRDFGIQDLATVSILLVSNTALQELAIKEVKNYLSSEMNLKI